VPPLLSFFSFVYTCVSGYMLFSLYGIILHDSCHSLSANFVVVFYAPVAIWWGGDTSISKRVCGGEIVYTESYRESTVIKSLNFNIISV
jgi:hypothetical protein